jgi:hypothetical protein
MLKQLAKAKSSQGGAYLKPGKYTFALNEIKVENTPMGGETFIAELLVLESENYLDAEKANAVGTTVNFLQQLEKRPMVAFPATKAFIEALVAEESVGEDDFVESVKAAISKEQPLRGALVKAETYNKLTKDKSKTLVLPKWSSVNNTVDTIAARRKLMDSGASAAAVLAG